MYLKRSEFFKLLSFKNLGILLIAFYICIRLPYLGFSNFNTDSFKWKTRIYDFGSGVFNLNLEQTVQKYHPGVTLLWIGTGSVKVYNFFYESVLQSSFKENSIEFVFSLNFYQILFLVIFQSLLVFLLYYFLSQIYDYTKAFLVLAVLTIEPFFLGITTTLHLDGLLNLLLLNFLVTFYLSVIKNDRYFLYLSAIFFGLSLLTKTTALLMVGVVFLTYLVKIIYEKNLNFIFYFKNSLIFLVTTFLIYFILWPGMWFDPIGTLSYVYKGVSVGTEDHSQIYFGNLVNDPGSFYYLIVSFIKATIYIFPALLLVGYIQLNTTYKKYTFEIFLLVSAILYLIEISIPSKKLDRYIFTFLILISLTCYSYIYDFSKKLLIYFFSINLFFILFLNFDYFSYYNPLAGGIKNGIFWVEPKWIFGQKEISDYFLSERNNNNYEEFDDNESISEIKENHNKLVVAVPEKYYTQLYPYFRLINSWLVINTLKPEAVKANYFIFPVWEDTSSSGNFISRYNLIYYDQVRVRGVPIFNVYKVNGR